MLSKKTQPIHQSKPSRPDPFDEADIYGDPTESFSFAGPDVVEPQEILVEVSEGGGCNSEFPLNSRSEFMFYYFCYA
jgi:predicted methyltransferase